MTAPSLPDVAHVTQVEQLHGVMSAKWERQQRPRGRRVDTASRRGTVRALAAAIGRRWNR